MANDETIKQPETNQPLTSLEAEDNPFAQTTNETTPPEASEHAKTAAPASASEADSTATPTPAAAKDPWAEPVPVAPPTSTGMPMLVLGTLLLVAVVVIVFLFVRIQDLNKKTDQLLAESLQKTAQITQLNNRLENTAPGIRQSDIVILSAVYGSGTQFRDVTDRVRELLSKPDAEFFSRPEWLQNDPTPGWNKELVIIFTRKGQRHIFMTGEGGRVTVAALVDAAK